MIRVPLGSPSDDHWSTSSDSARWVSIANGVPLCPDRLTAAWFGEADTRRGRLVLRFVRLLDRLWPVRDRSADECPHCGVASYYEHRASCPHYETV